MTELIKSVSQFTETEPDWGILSVPVRSGAQAHGKEVFCRLCGLKKKAAIGCLHSSATIPSHLLVE